MTDVFGVFRQHLALSLSLFARFGAVLTAIVAGALLLEQALLLLAVEIGMASRFLGLVAIAPVILLQLLLFVSMFVILRNGLPRIRLRRTRGAVLPASAGAAANATPEGGAASGFYVAALVAALIPFYGYYAGWGLLGETLRSYSQLFYVTQVSRMDLSNDAPSPAALDVGDAGWVVLAVVLIWLVRRGAKALHARSERGIWALVVVACEATWALLGLYVIAGWKDAFAAWLATLPSPGVLLDWLVPAASAAVTDVSVLPVDDYPPFRLWPALSSLFWYALLPLVWFNLGAIVYGHDMHALRPPVRRLTGRALDRWQALPRPVTDFIGHFWAGFVKRWHAITNGVLLAASAGVALTCSVLVLWRLVDWLGNWAWVGLAHLIGPHDLLAWQVLAVPLNALFGAPGGAWGGLLVSPLQFCILAAGIELAGRAQAVVAAPIPETAPASS